MADTKSPQAAILHNNEVQVLNHCGMEYYKTAATFYYTKAPNPLLVVYWNHLHTQVWKNKFWFSQQFYLTF
jgi:hypothetical protein